MMRTTPSRRTILQCSHRTLTDGLTFISCPFEPFHRFSLESVRDPAAGQVVGRQLDLDLVPGQDPNEVHAHLAGHVHLHLVRSHGHHRLDGEHHAGLERGPAAGLAEVRHLRILVERAAYPMPHECPHHPETVTLTV